VEQVHPVILKAVGCSIFDEQDSYPGIPSTIIDVSSGSIKLLREGAISRAEIEAVLGYTLTL
jgi:tRNA A37 threonylcarbamoyladenosine synthetase subunit TsaC/SUA5/YrdC